MAGIATRLIRNSSPWLWAALFLLASIAWILVTDHLVANLAGQEDATGIRFWQSAKGLFYVAGTTLVLLALLALRRRQRSELEASRTRLSQIVESALDAIITIDAQGRVLEWNPAAEKLFGRSRESMLGQPMHELIMKPEDALRHLSALERAVESGDVRLANKRLQMTALDADGHELEVELTITRSSNSGQPRFTGFVRDVSRLHQARQQARDSEDRYRKLIHYSNDAVIMSSESGKVLFVSPAIQRIMGYSPEEFAGLDSLAQVHPDDVLKVKDIHARLPKANGVVFRSVHRVRHKDGRWVWVEQTLTSWLADPAIGAIIGNVHDVTDRMSLQEQLNHAAKMDGIGRLAGGVAHDFNNLLTAISGYAQLLDARIGDDSVAASQAERIIDAAGRATDLTRRLLAFSRRQLLQPKIIDLNERVMEMDVLLRHIIGEQVELVMKPAGNLSNVSADPGQIDQVILNLAVNARDAMPKGGRLTIETGNVTLDEAYANVHPEVLPGKYVMLAVSDNGVGMDAETKARAFEPFFTTKEAGQGTGLGLAMVYGIVRQSNGHIWLYSEPGRGTVFRIYLPTTEEEREPVDAVPAAPPAGGTETILVAEDEDAVRTLVSDVLNMNGYKVLAARSGNEALQLLPGMDVKLLLTDVVMPGMSGKELADTVCEQCPGVKVIYMSGYTDEAIVENGNVLQEIEFMQKPFSPTALLKRIREVLDA